jgi:hypothetical protein
MGIRLYKPYTASTRNRSVSDFSEITQPVRKSLLYPLHCSRTETEVLSRVDTVVVGIKVLSFN